MKKILKITAAVMLMAVFAIPMNSSAKSEKSLYNRFNGKGEVKTYVSDITDSSGAAKADLAALKKQIENALRTRMTIRFVLVPENEADVIVTCDILEFLWMEDDPIDQVHGAIAIALDAAMSEHYARMQAVFCIIDVKTKKPIWREKLQATITDSEMHLDDSVPMLNERITKVFMRKAFAKPGQPRI